MRRIIFERDVLDDYADWGIYQRNIFKRIYELLKDIGRHPFEGIGKPEPLKGNLSGYCRAAVAVKTDYRRTPPGLPD
jgi:toxin YoeB